MKVTPGHVVALCLGLGAVVAFDRWSTREDRWRAELAATAARVRSEDSVSYHALRARAIRDSLMVDSLEVARASEESNRIRLAQELGRTRVLLAEARDRNDTSAIITQQEAVIVQQDSVIRSDSLHKATLRATVASQAGTIIDLNESLRTTRQRLADLVAIAERPPKEFKLLGLTLSFKPFVGYGVTVNPATMRVDHGVQLGLSILRG